MTAKVILNPYSGRWKGRELRSAIEAALRAAGVEFELVATDGPNHGTDLARQAVLEGYSPIIAAGGDGSISEVVNGMLLAVQETGQEEIPPLGIMPLGTANDLVVNLGMPVGLEEAAKVIAGGHYRRIDIGKVTYGDDHRVRYFDNNSAIGLEPMVTLVQQRIHNLRGTIRYIVAALMAIMQNPQWEAHLEWEGGEYTGGVTLVTVGNTPLTGGVFYMTPHASPDDGKLTFVYAFMRSRMRILSMLPRTMKAGVGSYVEHPDAHEINTGWLKIKMRKPTPLHADGEIQSTSVQDIDYELIPGMLPVLVPQA